MGRYAHALDDKRRVAIPKSFREELAQGGECFYLLPSFDKCLWLLPQRRFDELKARLKNMKEPGYGIGDERLRTLHREIFSRGSKVMPDKQGRIALSPELCRQAGIDKEVVFLGVDERIELWSPEAPEVKDDPDRLPKLGKDVLG